jgi:hypothetical protein
MCSTLSGVARLLNPLYFDFVTLFLNALAIVRGSKPVFHSLDLPFPFLPELTVGGPLPVPPSQYTNFVVNFLARSRWG